MLYSAYYTPEITLRNGRMKCFIFFLEYEEAYYSGLEFNYRVKKIANFFRMLSLILFQLIYLNLSYQTLSNVFEVKKMVFSENIYFL